MFIRLQWQGNVHRIVTIGEMFIKMQRSLMFFTLRWQGSVHHTTTIGLCHNIVIVIYVRQITMDMYVHHIVMFIYVCHIATLLFLALLHCNIDYVLSITLRHYVLFVTLWHQLLYVTWHCKVMVNKLQRRVFVCQIMALEKFCHSPIEGICSSHFEIRKCLSHCNVGLCCSHDYVTLCTSHCENGFCSSHWDIWKDNATSGYVCQIAMWGYDFTLQWEGNVHHIVTERKCSLHCDEKEMFITLWRQGNAHYIVMLGKCSSHCNDKEVFIILRWKG